MGKGLEVTETGLIVRNSGKLNLSSGCLGFPGVSAGKESACNAGDLGLKDPLEKGKATHSGILAWRIPWTV